MKLERRIKISELTPDKIRAKAVNTPTKKLIATNVCNHMKDLFGKLPRLTVYNRGATLESTNRKLGKENSMATKLNKPVSRETAKTISGREVIVTIAPCGAQSEARIGLRLKGKRTQYVCALSDICRMAALWHGQKEAKARRDARKAGVLWRHAKKKFIQENSI